MRNPAANSTNIKNQFKKEVPQKKSYSEEPVNKDRDMEYLHWKSWSYITAGDTANLELLQRCSILLFLQARHSIVPKP